MLEFKGVYLGFGAQAVLRDVSFSLPPGGRLAVMGPSGCGKTTLLRAAAGLLRADGGEIVPPAGGAAMIFQEPRLLPWLTAEENVNLVLSDSRATLPRARQLLADLALDGAEGKYPAELSGGMQRRVAIARALALERELLILDEPFTALDGELKERVMGLIDGQKCSLLLSTHERSEAERLHCGVMWLRGGGLVRE